MGPVKQIEETLNSIQPEVPIEKTTSPSEIMSLGWAVACLILGPASGYIAWRFFSSPIMLGGLLDFMLPPFWLFMALGIFFGLIMAFHVLSIRDAQVQAYLKNGGNPKRLT